MDIENVLIQIGLTLGFSGSVLLAFSARQGVITQDGRIIFYGIGDTAFAEENIRRVKASHWRSRYFTKVGWSFLSAAFFLQIMASLT